MGLLDTFSDNQFGSRPTGGLLGLDPTTIGLLSAASAALQAGGPSRVPVSTGQVLGHMLESGLTGYQGALDRQMKRQELDDISQYRRAQAEQLRQKASDAKDLSEFFKSRLGGATGTMPAADMDASTQALGQGAAVGDIGPTLTNAARMNTIRPPQLQGQSSAFPFSLNDVAFLKTKGVDLSDVYKLATDPVKLEGGSVYVDRTTGARNYIPKLDNGFMLNGDGSASVVPGYIQGNASIKGAETMATEGAKANFDLLPLNYVDQSGRPLGGTRANYISSLGGSAFPGGQPAQQGREGLDLTRLTPQQQAFLRQKDPEAFVNGVSRFAGSTPGSFAGSAPVLQSEAEKQQQLGAITGRQQTQQDLNKNWITASYNPIVEAGRSANTMMASLDALKNIDLKTGWGTEARAHAANVLTSLGIGSDNAKLFAANAQKFQSVAMGRLMTVLQDQKGQQTEGDAQRAAQTWVQLQNTPEANQFIANFARAKANMDTRKAQFYQEALPLAQQNGDLNEIDRRWAKIQGSIWDDPALQPYARSK